MPRIQVYLPDDLYQAVKSRGLPASELLQQAVKAELELRDALDEADRYVAALSEEVGEPSPRQLSRADAIAQRIRNRSLHQAG